MVHVCAREAGYLWLNVIQICFICIVIHHFIYWYVPFWSVYMCLPKCV